MRRHVLAATALLLLPMLTACASDGDIKEAEAGCPAVDVLQETGSVTRLKDGSVASRANIGDFTGSCAIGRSETVMTLSIPVVGTQGPAGAPGTTEQYPMFAAVVDPDSKPLSKQPLAATLTYDARMATVAIPAEVHVPLRAGTKAGQYQVLLGFQLTPEELAFNRNPMAGVR